jgi:ABC-type polysaccharide/polyol phosphate export permease
MDHASDEAIPGALVVERARDLTRFESYLREIWERRSLVRVLVRRQLKGSYEMSIVGFAWWMLEPVSLAIVYYVLFTFIFHKSQPYYILILLVALLPNKWLSSTVVQSMGTVRANVTLVTDVYFPRALLPITEATVGLAHFGVGLLILPLVMLAYRTWGGLYILLLPIVVAVQLLFMVGLAYPMSVWGLSYRNLPGVMNNLLRLWFYLSPGIWTLELIANRRALIRTAVLLNPLTGLFESYRRVLIQGRLPGLELLWTAIVGSVLFFCGLFYFSRREGRFGKML